MTKDILIIILNAIARHKGLVAELNEMNNHSLFYLTLSIIAALGIAASPAKVGTIPSYEWGTLLAKVRQTLPTDEKYIQFTPAEKPKYKNRIMNYITAIDSNLLNKIKILRIESSPRIDYLFVNNKLYSMIENWEPIDRKAENAIRSRLTRQFGIPSVQQDKNFYIYSFNTDKTKVFWYLMKLPNSTSDCMIYYYPRQLFRMLMSE
ncbi:MAG: hypothetical protein A2W19_17345 [Spirochaetes bacterium RBG_16_49_21]|nr:MAG: hypothetical protein A2W19_17345 [Spirochaetes bacterium RBG_16_49_21]